MSKCHTSFNKKFGPDQFSRFEVYWTHKQTGKRNLYIYIYPKKRSPIDSIVLTFLGTNRQTSVFIILRKTNFFLLFFPQLRKLSTLFPINTILREKKEKFTRFQFLKKIFTRNLSLLIWINENTEYM